MKAWCAPHARRVWVQAYGLSALYAADSMIRDVMSTRSSCRPSIMYCQPSSWVIVVSAMPPTTAQRSRTSWQARCAGTCCSRLPRIMFHVVLTASHISSETVSRERRALSRAP